MTAMLPAHLTETLNNLGDAAREMAEEVRSDRAQRAIEQAQREKVHQAAMNKQRRQNRWMIILLAFLAVALAALLTIVVQNRARSNENAEILRQTARTSEQIADCTTTGGTCYERGTARTESALGRFAKMLIAVEACAEQHDGEAAIEACAMRRLGTTRPEPTPSSSTPD